MDAIVDTDVGVRIAGLKLGRELSSTPLVLIKSRAPPGIPAPCPRSAAGRRLRRNTALVTVADATVPV